MTESSPITPPPELVEQWRTAPEYANGKQMFEMVSISTPRLQQIATQAARWGADQELLACGKYLEQCAAWEPEDVTEMYNSRRPKPPSLKEQALETLRQIPIDPEAGVSSVGLDTIRRALEQLDD